MHALSNLLITGLGFFDNVCDWWRQRKDQVEIFMDREYPVINKQMTAEELEKKPEPPRRWKSAKPASKKRKIEPLAEERQHRAQIRKQKEKADQHLNTWNDEQGRAKFQAQITSVEFVKKNKRPTTPMDPADLFEADNFLMAHCTGDIQLPQILDEGFANEYKEEGVSNTLKLAKQHPNKIQQFPSKVCNAVRRIAIYKCLMHRMEQIKLKSKAKKEEEDDKYAVTITMNPDLELKVALPDLEEKIKYRDPELWNEIVSGNNNGPWYVCGDRMSFTTRNG